MKKIESIAGFINEIQSNLSKEAFISFKTALALYKEVHSIYYSVGYIDQLMLQAIKL